MTIEPSATPREVAAILAVLGAQRDVTAEAPTSRPSAWREAALREAVRPFRDAREDRR